MAKLAVAVIAMLLVAGCGSAQRLTASQSPGGEVIPWLPLPANLTPVPVPSPQPIPIPPGTPACTADQIVGAAVGSQGATGHVITSFAFSGAG